MAEDSKSIRFRIDADDSAFNEKMRQIQQRMRQFDQSRQYQQRASQVTAGSSGFSDNARRAFEREQQQHHQQLRKDDQFMSQQIQKKERHLDNIMKKKQTIAAMNKADADLSDKEIKRLEVKKRLVNEIGDLHRKQGETRQRLGAQDGGGGAGGGAGGGQDGMPGVSPMGKFSNFMRAIGGAAILRGAMNAGGAIAQDYATRERTVLQGQRAVLDYGARPMREVFAGRGSEQAFWSQERSKAIGLGLQEAERQRIADSMRTAGTMGGGVIGGAIAGGIGGSILPGVGTAVGAIGGGIAGGLAGVAGAGERGRAQVFDQQRYQAMLLQQAAGSSQQMEASIMARDPRKFLARQEFMKNVNQYSGLSRRLGGLSDVELFGEAEGKEAGQFANRPYGDKRTFSELVAGQEESNRNRRLGLLREQMNVGLELGGLATEKGAITQQIQEIIGAGGDTGAAKAGGGRAAAMNRQLNVRNVGQIMGRISGAGAGVDTDEATKRLLANAVMLGVDASKMPVEMERMTNITAKLATAGGGFSNIAAEVFGAGVGGFSQAEITGAETAFGIQRKKAKQGGGYEGQLGLGFLIGEGGVDAFGKKAAKTIKSDADLMNMMNQSTAADLEKDPAKLQAMADKLGIDPEEVLSGMRKKDAFKQTRTGEAQEALEEFGKAKAKLTTSQIQEFIKTGDIRGVKPKVARDLRSKYLEAQEQMAATEGEAFTGLGAAAQRARVFGVGAEAAGVRQTPGEVEAAGEEIDKELRREKDQASEREKDSKARGEKFKIDTLAEHAENFGKAAKETGDNMVLFGVMFENLRAALDKGGDADITKPLQELANQMSAMAAKMAEDNSEAGVVDANAPSEQ